MYEGHSFKYCSGVLQGTLLDLPLFHSFQRRFSSLKLQSLKVEKKTVWAQPVDTEKRHFMTATLRLTSTSGGIYFSKGNK